MNDINNCTFTGNLTRDAELKYTGSGTAVSSFGLAVNEKYGDTQNVSFFDFAIFGKFAEAMTQYLTKGKSVSVVAKAKQDRWEKDGKSHSKISFIVKDIRLFSDGKKPSNSFEDDIPFN